MQNSLQLVVWTITELACKKKAFQPYDRQVGYVQSALRVNLEEVVWSPTRTDIIYQIFRQNYLRTDCRNNGTHRSYPEGVNVVSIIVCLKDIRDYKYESVLLDKSTIYLHISCSSFAEDLSEGAKAPFRPEVLQFSRW